MNQQVKISIILCYYNTEISLIKRAINSISMQDFKDFELLIVNDGSDTDHESVLRHHITTLPFDCSYHFHENIGQSLSINKMVPLSKGKYITILDSDDEYKTNHLSACLNEMKHADLIASKAEVIADIEDDHYVVDRNDCEKKIHVDECILLGTLFGKREVFEKYPFKKIYSADAEFFGAASNEFRVKKTDLRTYIYYRNNPNSICSTLKKNQTTNNFK